MSLEMLRMCGFQSSRVKIWMNIDVDEVTVVQSSILRGRFVTVIVFLSLTFCRIWVWCD